MTLRIYGIKNCGTMKKAFEWLDAQHIPYSFHDYKKNGVDAVTLTNWTDEVGWQKLLNTKGTTWRGLSDAERADIDAVKAIELMEAKPSLIRRPVITGAAKLLVGFDPALYAEILKG